MTDRLLTCFEGMHPMDVLVSYVLFVFGEFKARKFRERVEVRFLFRQFAHGRITPCQFRCIAASFDNTIRKAAEELITACICPVKIETPLPGYNWTPHETMLLIAGATLSTGFVLPIMLKRSPDSWPRRVTRVIDELRRNKVLNDDKPQNLAFSKMESLSILPPDGRSLQNGKITRGMRLVRSLQTSQISARANHARLRKQIGKLTDALTAATLRCDGTENETNDGNPKDTMVNQTPHSAPSHSPKRGALLDGDEIGEQTEPDLGPTDLCHEILCECFRNASVVVHARRYSNTLFDISELLRLTSLKTYRILRTMLPLPSETALYYKYSSAIREVKLALTDLDLAVVRLEDLLTTGAIANTPATIGIDAFSFRTFAGTPLTGTPAVHEEYSNAFVFLHIPLDANQKIRLLHLQKKSNGSYDQTTGDVFLALSAVYKRHNIPVWYKATDGDRYLTSEHDSFFAEHIEPHRKDYTLLLQEIHEKLCAGVTMPIPDPLHFTKNIRGKLIDHKLAIVDSDVLVLLVELDSLKKVLDLGDALDDHSQLGRMRDVYVTRIFTLRNVCALADAKQYAAALVFLPYSCVLTLLYCTNIPNHTRLFLAKLAYLCFDRLLDEAEKLVKSTPAIKHRFSADTIAITIAEPNYFKRMLHSCLAFGIGLRFGPERLRLDAIGTHLVENSIGVARSTANSTRWSSIASAFAAAEVRKDIARKYIVQLRVSKRINDGGAKVSTLSDEGVAHPESWDAHDITSMFTESCYYELMKTG